ncbi:phosphotransferase family protein [Hydrocarboniphaga sp.]|uniref:phosphotransferase family protein n=1 Tax=Hydrocarboniphaga sp. TaxID=2033016 RepID=UPI003D14E120
MLDRFESQILRACVADLTSRVTPTIQDPGAAATLSMASRLLAHVASRLESAQLTSPDAEVAALQAEEAREDALLRPDNAADGITAESLSLYVGKWIEGAEVSSIEASLGGFSKRTLLLRLSGAPQLDNALVIRCDEVGGPVESASADELAILRLMHRHSVPVAEPLWADPAFPFGGTALSTRRLAGSSAYRATGPAMGPVGPQAARELAKVLAKVHAVPVAELDLSPELRAARLPEHVKRLVSSFKRQLDRYREQPSLALDAAFDYLLTHVPTEAAPPTIVHGDASLRNLMLDGDRVSGLVDWELWHLGDPNEDLAYCRPEVEQVMAWEEFLAEYQAAGGAPWSAEAGAYYGLFGAVRNAVFGITIIHGFTRSDRPETRYAFAALYLARKLVSDVVRRLKELGVATADSHVE